MLSHFIGNYIIIVYSQYLSTIFIQPSPFTTPHIRSASILSNKPSTSSRSSVITVQNTQHTNPLARPYSTLWASPLCPRSSISTLLTEPCVILPTRHRLPERTVGVTQIIILRRRNVPAGRWILKTAKVPSFRGLAAHPVLHRGKSLIPR